MYRLSAQTAIDLAPSQYTRPRATWRKRESRVPEHEKIISKDTAEQGAERLYVFRTGDRDGDFRHFFRHCDADV